MLNISNELKTKLIEAKTPKRWQLPELRGDRGRWQLV